VAPACQQSIVSTGEADVYHPSCSLDRQQSYCSLPEAQQRVSGCRLLLVLVSVVGEAIATPLTQDFMAAAVVLEHMVRREYLKPYWRLWCYPTPSPEDTGKSLLVAPYNQTAPLHAAAPHHGCRGHMSTLLVC
jgi:hypothetical protein